MVKEKKSEKERWGKDKLLISKLGKRVHDLKLIEKQTAEKVKKLKEELKALKSFLKSSIQTDSYGDRVLEAKGTLTNLDEFEEEIDKIFGKEISK